jgi:hypothetical protein
MPQTAARSTVNCGVAAMEVSKVVKSAMADLIAHSSAVNGLFLLAPSVEMESVNGSKRVMMETMKMAMAVHEVARLNALRVAMLFVK